jgi:hypothetical protein
VPRCHRDHATEAPGCLGPPRSCRRGIHNDGGERLRYGGNDGVNGPDDDVGISIGGQDFAPACRAVSEPGDSVTVDDVGTAGGSVVDHGAGRTEVPDVSGRQRLEHEHFEAASGFTQCRVASRHELVVDVPASRLRT